MNDHSVPYIVHESEVARLERIIKRLWILVIIVFITLIATNAYWIWNESQYVDEISVSQDIDTGNGTAVFSGTGDVSYGENKANSD